MVQGRPTSQLFFWTLLILTLLYKPKPPFTLAQTSFIHPAKNIQLRELMQRQLADRWARVRYFG
jgi:hypothetical protein